MAIKLFGIMAFFATAVLWPINAKYRDFRVLLPGNGTNDTDDDLTASWPRPTVLDFNGTDFSAMKGKKEDLSYLWAYTVFTYFFATLAIYTINWETFRIIRYRQDYLGSQSTITDRTFRLTGIPEEIRSEERVKKMIEKLEIGIVDSVTLCRDWKKLDDMIAERDELLRKLETAWAKLLKQKKDATNSNETSQNGNTSSTERTPETTYDEEDGREADRLLAPDLNPEEQYFEDGERPQISIRYGSFALRSKKVDAIDYYEEKLRRLDSKIVEARKQTYHPTDMALVTMDTVASCQMVTQARIDPRPGRLLTKPTPSPSDMVWRKTYEPRGVRRTKSWLVTIFIAFLTLLWIFPTATIASLVSMCAIKKVLPSLATEWLMDHSVALSLLQNGLPTLVVSLLNIAVPYLYDWLSNRQGMISQSDVELSVISKNFFFTFFNTFFVFAVSKTGLDFWGVLYDFLKDTSKIPNVISKDVEDLSIFYISFIMLQGIGLMPFRILEVGSVVLTPIYRMLATTPREFTELKNPPHFQYGFYLPTALLVFNLCLIYSVLRWGFAILIFGTIYFCLGYMTFKYMVLYAMDQPQHATGGAWRIICYRIIIGLLVFEVVMIGQLALNGAFAQSILISPLIPFTIWYSYYFKQRFEPLTKYIALRAIQTDDNQEDALVMEGEFEDEGVQRPSQGLLRRGSTLDEAKERGLKFVNPSLVVPYVIVYPEERNFYTNLNAVSNNRGFTKTLLL